MLHNIGRRLTDSVVTVAVLGGVCYFLGAYAMARARSGAYLPSELLQDDKSEQLVTVGALTLFIVASGLSAIFCLLVLSYSLLLRLPPRWWRPRIAPLQNWLKEKAREAGRSERRIGRWFRSYIAVSPKVPLIFIACGCAYLLVIGAADWLSASVKGTPYLRAEVRLADETLNDLRYVRRTDGFFLFLAEDKMSYLLIPDSDVRRVQLFPVINAEE